MKYVTLLIACVAICALSTASFAGGPWNPPNPCGNHGNNCDEPEPPTGGGDVDVDIDTGDVKAYGGDGGSVFGSGNSLTDVQVHTKTGTSTVTGTETTTSTTTGQAQKNTATGSGNVTRITENYEAQRRNPVSSAPMSLAGMCSRGAAAQGVGLGGSIAFTNEMCDLAASAQMAKEAAVFLFDLAVTFEPGDLRDEFVRRGLKHLDRHNKITKRAAKLALARANEARILFQYIPVVGPFM